MLQNRVNELKYLGFLVGSTGYRPDPACLNPLMNALTSVSHVALHSTLGFLQYYSRFIPNFASRADSLFYLKMALHFK